MIELKNVSKVYPNGTIALDKVNLKFNKGDFVILMGESGAGKTTLLKIIRGDEEPTEGTVLFEGVDIQRYNRTSLRRKIGFAFQDLTLIDDRTVFDNVSLPMQFRGASFREIHNKVEAVLSEVRLREKMYKLVKELSYGEKQRVSIARALIYEPIVLLLDEPTGNLDVDTARAVLNFVEVLNERGTTVIMSTHHLIEFGNKPKGIIKIRKGRIVGKEYV
ncbi:cell division ATP-binding protein FtsE [Caldisericum exile]|uniref:Cell division ATP-binding protein FtsE n=1 Tax=Caldisericum exile (strain DSM 21853 / NBRC 104410 / AZM16c01) TaxID=511051 RepID=A0A7U6GF15_CALEA|nr:ATP-binding cassette domain-containing protein [Caldisericum exile]BAL81179.1 cell division protein FtsE [Caldisericum exile AZM16c01]